MDWFGRARISFTHAAKPLPLKRKDGTPTNLLEVCKKATPPCQLNPLLFNGHIQTMWTSMKEEGPHIYYRRKIFDADHKTYNGSFAVDFAVPQHDDHDEALPPRTAYFSEDDFAKIGSDDSKPMLIVLHGLSGGSYESYLRHAIAPLVLNGGGWEALVVNARGCANSEVTSGVLFNARATWDVRQVRRRSPVPRCRETYKYIGRKMGNENIPQPPSLRNGFFSWRQYHHQRKHVPIGQYSLTLTIMFQYVGEEGDQCPLKACISVGNPFDLELSNKALQRNIIGHHVYQRVMGSTYNTISSFWEHNI